MLFTTLPGPQEGPAAVSNNQRVKTELPAWETPAAPLDYDITPPPKGRLFLLTSSHFTGKHSDMIQFRVPGSGVALEAKTSQLSARARCLFSFVFSFYRTGSRLRHRRAGPALETG